jgi:hypothetical protein
MLKALDDLVETRIRDALERGELTGLPGEGRPLPDEDLSGVPAALRVAYLVLRNAGCVPVEVEALRDLDALLARATRDADTPQGRDCALRRRGERKLRALVLALEQRGLGRSTQALLADRDRLVDHLGT